MSDEPIIAIVPAAGVGERARAQNDDDRPKQYRLLNGLPMLRHAVCALLADARIDQVRVAVSAHDGWADEALAGLARTVVVRCGGATRADTVANALAEAEMPDAAWVLVHDAARPGLPAQVLAGLIDACRACGRGALLALPVADTVKRGGEVDMSLEQVGAQAEISSPVAGESAKTERRTTLTRVDATVDRSNLWLAQTPQMYQAGMLRDALLAATRAGLTVTDESQAMEHVGCAPLLVRGSVRNFKVTWPEDFELMEKWL